MQGYPEESRIAGTSFAFVEGDPAQMDLLNTAGVQFSDAIIVGGTDSRPDKEADALTLSMVMLTQECLAVSGRDPSNPAHIVGMVRERLQKSSNRVACPIRSSISAEGTQLFRFNVLILS